MANKILVSLPEKFLEDVDRAAAEEHRSRSELIREALRAYLDVRENKKESGNSPRLILLRSPNQKPGSLSRISKWFGLQVVQVL